MDGCFGGVLGPPQLSQLNSPKYCKKKKKTAIQTVLDDLFQEILYF